MTNRTHALAALISLALGACAGPETESTDDAVPAERKITGEATETPPDFVGETGDVEERRMPVRYRGGGSQFTGSKERCLVRFHNETSLPIRIYVQKNYEATLYPLKQGELAFESGDVRLGAWAPDGDGDGGGESRREGSRMKKAGYRWNKTLECRPKARETFHFYPPEGSELEVE